MTIPWIMNISTKLYFFPRNHCYTCSEMVSISTLEESPPKKHTPIKTCSGKPILVSQMGASRSQFRKSWSSARFNKAGFGDEAPLSWPNLILHCDAPDPQARGAPVGTTDQGHHQGSGAQICRLCSSSLESSNRKTTQPRPKDEGMLGRGKSKDLFGSGGEGGKKVPFTFQKHLGNLDGATMVCKTISYLYFINKKPKLQ